VLAVLKETAIPFEDLRKISVECADCAALVVLDLEGQLNLTHCPACHKDFPPAVKEILTGPRAPAPAARRRAP
jgi:hypothetical protein